MYLWITHNCKSGAKGHPRKDKNATHNFKSSKPSNTDKVKNSKQSKKRERSAQNDTEESEPPKKRGRPPGSKNKPKVTSDTSNKSKSTEGNLPQTTQVPCFCNQTGWACFKCKTPTCDFCAKGDTAEDGSRRLCRKC